jgi:hypothetical protein
MTSDHACPFKIGERVRFNPDAHANGWSWSSFDRVRLYPGDVGNISRIATGGYVYLDDERGGFHWECFERVES